jgi:hypothetical protein
MRTRSSIVASMCVCKHLGQLHTVFISKNRYSKKHATFFGKIEHGLLDDTPDMRRRIAKVVD